MTTIKEENEQINGDAPPEPETPAKGGEDDGSTEVEGDDSHLHEDQKSKTP